MTLRDELEKLMVLSASATPGPWEACDRGAYEVGGESEGSVWNDDMRDIDGVSTIRPLSSQDTIRGDTTYRDATFIAATANFLRDHGPALLEAVVDAERLDFADASCDGVCYSTDGIAHNSVREAIDYDRAREASHE